MKMKTQKPENKLYRSLFTWRSSKQGDRHNDLKASQQFRLLTVSDQSFSGCFY